MNLPKEFLEKLSGIPGYESIVFNRKKTTLRINTIKSQADGVVESLGEQGFDLKKIDGLDLAFTLESKSQRELSETDEYKQGLIYLQNASSQIPAVVLSPKPGDTVLDICAAPGSKTTQMAAMMENTGQIIANDMSRVRLYKLSSNLKSLGVTNTTTFHLRAQDMWRKFPNTFDKVLVDVPCSMEGRFIDGYEKSYKDWSLKKVAKLSSYQKQILHSAVSCTKPGGVIVYSTCTISPEENEEVISWFLNKHKGQVELVDVEINSKNVIPGLNDFGGEKYIEGIGKTKRIVPDDVFEAFYVAKLIKLN